MILGTVKWYNSQKGYGFLTPDTRVNGGSDVFIHVSELDASRINDLAEGARLGFELGTSKRTGRPCAVGLKLL